MSAAIAGVASGTFGCKAGFTPMAHRKQIEFDNDTFLALKQLGSAIAFG